MSIPRALGIVIFFAVPGIIGGGIIYHFAESWTAILIYELIVVIAAGAVLSKAIAGFVRRLLPPPAADSASQEKPLKN